MSENKLIINRLIECRKKIGISKNEAAKRIGISQPAYLRYEAGERTPSIQVINEIAKVLQTSVEYLTGRSDSPEVVSYVINVKEDPELFAIIERYYQADIDQQKRLLAYLKEFQKIVSK